ncbi:MAG: carboxypeptidase-like regulatory domain-containing protein [Longimicrobiales bacterium]
MGGPRLWSRRRPARIGAVLAGLLGSWSVGAPPGVAQETTAAADTARVTLIGEVRDYTNEEPILGATVRLVELELVRITDRNGFFAFEGIPPGEWTVETRQFGYETNVEPAPIGPGSLLLVRLEPRPVELDGLYVRARSALAARRSAAPSRVSVWTADQLAASPAADVGALIEHSGVATMARCGRQFTDTDMRGCVTRGNRVYRIEIFIDDLPVMDQEGTSRLWAYAPADLWEVEFVIGPLCTELRIYTRLFMEQVEAGRVRLHPAICVE